jgi:cytochrome P450
MSVAPLSTDLPFHPSPPEPPHFDPERSTWIFSRHADVQAALREPALQQASEKGEIEEIPDHSELYTKVQADIARLTAAEWRTRMQHQLSLLIESLTPEPLTPEPLTHRQPFNLVDRIIQPWSVAMLLSLSAARPEVAQRVAEIANSLFIQYEKNTELELDQMIEIRQFTLSKSMFFGLTQTLPSFLANAWLALLQHPDQMSKLLAEPYLITNATEELLRYAGIVNTPTRHATKDVTIGDILILKDQRLTLKLASANFDPAKFADPYQLDITRRPTGQLGLGTGLHACVGAVLVRSAFAAATPVFIAAQPTLAPAGSIEWTGTHVRWPRTVSAYLQQNT